MNWETWQRATPVAQSHQDERQREEYLELLEREEEHTRSQLEKIAWLCSYTPVEIIAACGLVPYRLLAAEGQTLRADTILHPTLCSYVRGALENALAIDARTLQGAVLLNSCNAAGHLQHALAALYSQKFQYFLDLPHSNSDAAIYFWANELRQFHETLACYRGIPVCLDALQQQMDLYRINRERLAALYADRKGEVFVRGSALARLVQASMVIPAARFAKVLDLFEAFAEEQKERGKYYGGPRLFLLGSIMGAATMEIIETEGGILVLDDLCTGYRAVNFKAVPPGGAESPYLSLARFYLGRSPCARMKDSFAALDRLEQLLLDYRIDGVILYYLKFCDPWYYLGQLLKERIKHIPVLILEGEYTGTGRSGQLRTRIAAFLEMLKA